MADLYKPFHLRCNRWSKRLAENDLKLEKERIHWNSKDALRALETEVRCESLKNGTHIERDFSKHLTVKIVEPGFNVECIKQLHPDIQKVGRLQPQPHTQRCFHVQLKEGCDPDEVAQRLEGLSLGDQRLAVETVDSTADVAGTDLTDIANYIDPLSLYVENLPHDFTKADIEQLFPKRLHAKIGRHHVLKDTRPVLLFFENAEDALAAYEATFDLVYRSYRLSVKFRRIDRRNDPCTLLGPKLERPPARLFENLDSYRNCPIRIDSSDDDDSDIILIGSESSSDQTDQTDQTEQGAQAVL